MYVYLNNSVYYLYFVFMDIMTVYIIPSLDTCRQCSYCSEWYCCLVLSLLQHKLSRSTTMPYAPTSCGYTPTRPQHSVTTVEWSCSVSWSKGWSVMVGMLTPTPMYVYHCSLWITCVSCALPGLINPIRLCPGTQNPHYPFPTQTDFAYHHKTVFPIIV